MSQSRICMQIKLLAYFMIFRNRDGVDTVLIWNNAAEEEKLLQELK